MYVALFFCFRNIDKICKAIRWLGPNCLILNYVEFGEGYGKGVGLDNLILGYYYATPREIVKYETHYSF